MGFGNLSISRVDGVSAVRPRIQTQEKVEPVRAERGRSADVESSRGLTESRGAERTKLRSRTSEEGSLTLTTADGDKVTISFRNQQSTKVDQAKLYGPDGSYERTRVRSRETSELSVSLEGSLSEEELADITDLVAKLSSGIESVRSGDVETAQEQISAPPDEDSTIASYSFAYQQSSSLSYKSNVISVTA